MEKTNPKTFFGYTDGQMENTTDLQLIVDSIPGGLFLCLFDKTLTLQYVSEGFLSMVGYTRHQLKQECQNQLARLIPPEDLARVIPEVRKQLAAGDKKIIEYRLRRRDGTMIWVLDKGRYTKQAGGVGNFCCVVIDITEKKAIERRLRLSLESQRIIMEKTNDIIFEWYPGSSEFLLSPNWNKLFGKTPEKRNGPLRQYVIKDLKVHPDDADLVSAILTPETAPSDGLDAPIRLKTLENDYLWFQFRLATQYDKQGNLIRYIGLLRDINKEKQQEEALLKKAENDNLTGLYNRNTARRLIDEILDRSTSANTHGLMFIDLDNFKQVNDTKGHLYGDAVLSGFAKSINKIFRNTDVVARFGGDEFIVFLNDIGSLAQAEKCAAQVLEAARALRHEIGGNSDFGCSIGISLYPKDAIIYEDLFQRADEALYHAKFLGRNQFVSYNPPFISGIHTSQGKTLTAIDSDKKSLSDFENNFINSAFNMMYTATDLQSAINLLIEIVGRHYDVSRTYVFEISRDGRYFSNTFEWCREGISAEINNLQNMPYDGYDDYFGNFDENGIFCCSDVKELPAVQRDVLEPQGIKSLLQCIISDGGKVLGFVGFDECKEPRVWEQSQVETATRCAHMLGVFLSKLRLQQRIKQLSENKE